MNYNKECEQINQKLKQKFNTQTKVFKNYKEFKKFRTKHPLDFLKKLDLYVIDKKIKIK